MSSYAKFCLIGRGVLVRRSRRPAPRCASRPTSIRTSRWRTATRYTFATERSGGADAAFSNPLNADRLRAAIEANMAARGVTKAADKAGADCVVGYALGTRQVFNDYYGGWGRAGDRAGATAGVGPAGVRLGRRLGI